VPGEGIAMVIGVDRVLDMCRTVVNVTGDMVTATFVAGAESQPAPPL
jgi:Na+/H+-dicarboxylate symporter